MNKIEKLLDLGWVDFCEEAMDESFNLKDMKIALNKESQGRNRSSYVRRLEERVRSLAAQEALK